MKTKSVLNSAVPALILLVFSAVTAFSSERRNVDKSTVETELFQKDGEPHGPAIPLPAREGEAVQQKRLDAAAAVLERLRSRTAAAGHESAPAVDDADGSAKNSIDRIRSALTEGRFSGRLLGGRQEPAARWPGFFPHLDAAGTSAAEFMLSPDLSVVSASPSDMTTSVDTEIEISVTFSDSLDPYADLAIWLMPEPLSFSDPTISADLKTVIATASLDSGTTYQMFVMSASTPDTQRVRPQLISTFSTGSVMPAGSLSGAATLPLDPADRLSVAVAFSLDLWDRDDPLYRINEVAAEDGSYTLDYLPAGDYMILLVQDINGDLLFNELDPMVFYDADGDNDPDIISLETGEARSGLDLQLVLLKVLSSYPADSATNVPADTSVTLTFSLPVDFDDEDFSPSIIPEPLEYGLPTVSADNKSITMPVILRDSTMYQVLVTEAETPGDMQQRLSEPYLAYFTTGSSFPGATLSGTAKFSDFEPRLAVAFLQQAGGDEQYFSNISDIDLSDGSFTIVNIAPGTYYPAVMALTGEQQLFAVYSDSVVIQDGETVTGIELTLELGADITLYGRVMTRSGGISEVGIELDNRSTYEYYEAMTNFLGYYRTEITAGRYDIRFNPPEASPFLSADTFDVDIESDTELNITLGSGLTLYGTVTDSSGSPLSEVSVEVTDSRSGEWITEELTDERGEYRLSVPPGVYDLAFRPWQGRQVARFFQNVTVNEDLEFNVMLADGSLVDGTIVNANSEPLEGVGVIAFEGDSWEPASATVTDDAGYYGFGLRPGTFAIYFDPYWSYNEYLPFGVGNVTVPPDTTINVTLQRASLISGRVTDPEDNPVEEVQIMALDSTDNWVNDTWTDFDGLYELSVPPGRYTLRVWPPSEEWLQQIVRNITVPPDTVVDIELQRPRQNMVSGKVMNSSAAMDSVRILFRNINTGERIFVDTGVDGGYSTTLLNGTYCPIFRLPMKWQDQGYPNQACSPPTVEIGADTTLDFILREGRTLTGTVIDTSGRPVERANLKFFEIHHSHWIQEVNTDESGVYRALLVPDSYDMLLTPPAFSDLFEMRSRLDLSGGETRDFTLKAIPRHDVGNVITSWAAGRFGMVGTSGGQGFQYPADSSNNLLYNGYLLVAVNEHQISEQLDFAPLGSPPYTVQTPGTVSDQDGRVRFSDSAGSPGAGVTVTQNSYAWAAEPDDDYVVFQMTITNDDSHAKDIVVGMLFDWDVGADPRQDMGDFDAANQMGYIYSGESSAGPYVGTAVLGAGEVSSYRVYDSAIEGHLNYRDKYRTLTEGFQQIQAGPGDMRYYIAAGPFTLSPSGQDSAKIAFALVAGDSLADLQANAAAAQTRYLGIISGMEPLTAAAAPHTFSLSPNYPNPFNPETTIRFGLPGESHVRLSLYNLLGQRIRTLVDGRERPGMHQIQWDGRNDIGEPVASGIYLFRIEAGDYIKSRKLLLLR